MTIFSIATDHNITAHATAAEAKSIAETEPFASAKELGRLAGNWAAAGNLEQSARPEAGEEVHGPESSPERAQRRSLQREDGERVHSIPR